ncbi:unnamed protein product, partial [Haemonchus placei]|uniref:Transposase n=1 Tax=Haemonchus placei TaxID=6290 RepID=A0A0N4WP13_HAEPC
MDPRRRLTGLGEVQLGDAPMGSHLAQVCAQFSSGSIRSVWAIVAQGRVMGWADGWNERSTVFSFFVLSVR